MVGWFLRVLREYQCDHEWERLIAANLFEKQDDKMPIRIIYSYRCKKCCAFRSRNILQ